MHPHLSTASEALSWLQANDMRRVELVFADLTSVARGKIMSTASFAETQAAKMPSLVLGLTVPGGGPPQGFKRIFPPMFPDMAMRPDWSTLVVDPLAGVPTATVICDIEASFTAADGHCQYEVAELSPRQLLKRVLARLKAAGYTAKGAPALEFLLGDPLE